MRRTKFSLRQFTLTKWSVFVYSTTRNASYVHPRLSSILELYRAFPIESNGHKAVHFFIIWVLIFGA